MTDLSTTLEMTVHLQTDYETARLRTIDALKAEGFGVLTEIDVKATMKQKLNIDFRQYTILGACNPPLAHRALMAAPEVGLLLPCNVTVAAADDGGTLVSAVAPLQMLGIIDNAELESVATEAQTRLRRAMDRLGAEG